MELGTELSKSRLFANVHSLVDSTKEVSDEFARLEAGVNERLVLGTKIKKTHTPVLRKGIVRLL